MASAVAAQPTSAPTATCSGPPPTSRMAVSAPVDARPDRVEGVGGGYLAHP